MRKQVWLGLQLLGTVLLVGAVAWNIDWGSFLALFPRIRWPWVGVAFVLTFILLLCGGLKWHSNLKGWRLPMTYAQVVRWVFVGHFLTNLMPGMVGQDAARLYGSSRATGRVSICLAVLAYDRLAGLVGLLLVGVWGLLWEAPLRGHLFFALVVSASALILASAIVLFNLPLFTRLLTVVGRRFPERFQEMPERFAAHLRLDGNRGRGFARAIFWGFVMQAMNAVAFHLCARALGVSLSVAEAALFLCLVSLVMIIPVSINGIGLREAASVQFFQVLGLPAEEAVAVSLIFFAQQMAWGLIGGLGLIGSTTSTKDLQDPALNGCPAPLPLRDGR